MRKRGGRPVNPWRGGIHKGGAGGPPRAGRSSGHRRGCRGLLFSRRLQASAEGAFPRITRTPIATQNAKNRNDFNPSSWSLGRPTRPPDTCLEIPPGTVPVPPTTPSASCLPYTTLRPAAEVRIQPPRTLCPGQGQDHPGEGEGVGVDQEAVLELGSELLLPVEEAFEVVKPREMPHQRRPGSVGGLPLRRSLRGCIGRLPHVRERRKRQG